MFLSFCRLSVYLYVLCYWFANNLLSQFPVTIQCQPQLPGVIAATMAEQLKVSEHYKLVTNTHTRTHAYCKKKKKAETISPSPNHPPPHSNSHPSCHLFRHFGVRKKVLYGSLSSFFFVKEVKIIIRVRLEGPAW